jgi:hypothetical protein
MVPPWLVYLRCADSLFGQARSGRDVSLPVVTLVTRLCRSADCPSPSVTVRCYCACRLLVATGLCQATVWAVGTWPYREACTLCNRPY